MEKQENVSISAETHETTSGLGLSVRQAQAGDSRAFAQLYGEYRSYVMAIIVDGVSDPHSQNDILQATFERAWTKCRSLRDPDAFKPWLAQIARRLIVDHHRAGSRLVQTDFATDEAAQDLASDDWSAIEWASMRELAETVQAEITHLSTRDAAVLELSSSFGFNAKEIGAALNVDTGHARVLVHRARQRLRAAVFPADHATSA